jgi:hypothetical protein
MLVNVSGSWTDITQEYPSHLEFVEIPSEKEDSVIQGTVESDETCRVKRKFPKEKISKGHNVNVSPPVSGHSTTFQYLVKHVSAATKLERERERASDRASDRVLWNRLDTSQDTHDQESSAPSAQPAK